VAFGLRARQILGLPGAPPRSVAERT
jgi:hypothetical protein